MPSYLSVILFALTNYRTDGIKPPIRPWQTSLPPPKEKDCHGRMSPIISAPQKKTSELSCHLLPPCLLTLASLCGLLYIPMAASSSKYICFQPHLATFLSPSPHLLINTSFAAPYSTFRSSHHWWLVDVARLCRECNGQYCVFWDEGVVNISRTPQMLSISGFPAWKNNEQEENKIVPGLLLPKDWAKKRFSAAKVFFFKSKL